jgi:hypothetical protein
VNCLTCVTCVTCVCPQRPPRAAVPTSSSTRPSQAPTTAWGPQYATTAPRGTNWWDSRTERAPRTAPGLTAHPLASVRSSSAPERWQCSELLLLSSGLWHRTSCPHLKGWNVPLCRWRRHTLPKLRIPNYTVSQHRKAHSTQSPPWNLEMFKQNIVFWHMTPCSPIAVYCRFGGTY